MRGAGGGQGAWGTEPAPVAIGGGWTAVARDDRGEET